MPMNESSPERDSFFPLKTDTSKEIDGRCDFEGEIKKQSFQISSHKSKNDEVYEKRMNTFSKTNENNPHKQTNSSDQQQEPMKSALQRMNSSPNYIFQESPEYLEDETLSPLNYNKSKIQLHHQVSLTLKEDSSTTSIKGSNFKANRQASIFRKGERQNSRFADGTSRSGDNKSVRFTENEGTIHQFDTDQHIEIFIAQQKEAASKPLKKERKPILKKVQSIELSEIAQVEDSKQGEEGSILRQSRKRNNQCTISNFAEFIKSPKNGGGGTVAKATKSKFIPEALIEDSGKSLLLKEMEGKNINNLNFPQLLLMNEKCNTPSPFSTLKEKQYEKQNYLKRSSNSNLSLQEQNTVFSATKKSTLLGIKEGIIKFISSLFKKVIFFQLFSYPSSQKTTFSPCYELSMLLCNSMIVGCLLMIFIFSQIDNWEQQFYDMIINTSTIQFQSSQSYYSLSYSSVTFMLLLIFNILQRLQPQRNSLHTNHSLQFLFNNHYLFKAKTHLKNPMIKQEQELLIQKYELYDKIIYNKQINNNKQSFLQIGYLIIFEIVLIVGNSLCLYQIQKQEKFENSNLHDNNYSLIHCSQEACVFSILIYFNYFITEYFMSLFTRMSFQNHEKQVIMIASFNTFILYCQYQAKYAFILNNLSFFDSNNNTNNLDSSAQIQSQILLMLSLTLLQIIEIFYELLKLFIKRIQQRRQSKAKIFHYDTIQQINQMNVGDEVNKLEGNIKQNNGLLPLQSTPEKSFNNFQYRILRNQVNNPQLLNYSSFYNLHRTNILMVILNSSILACLFTFPPALLLGAILNLFWVFMSDFKQNYFSLSTLSLQFIQLKQMKQLTDYCLYIFTISSITYNVIIATNCNIMCSLKEDSSLFKLTFEFLYSNSTHPALLYTIIVFLLKYSYITTKTLSCRDFQKRQCKQMTVN